MQAQGAHASQCSGGKRIAKKIHGPRLFLVGLAHGAGRLVGQVPWRQPAGPNSTGVNVTFAGGSVKFDHAGQSGYGTLYLYGNLTFDGDATLYVHVSGTSYQFDQINGQTTSASASFNSTVQGKSTTIDVTVDGSQRAGQAWTPVRGFNNVTTAKLFNNVTPHNNTYSITENTAGSTGVELDSGS
jgi:hypothetical protein